MSDQERQALNWIGLLVELALRARDGRPVSDAVRRALAPNPAELRDLELLEALLA